MAGLFMRGQMLKEESAEEKSPSDFKELCRLVREEFLLKMGESEGSMAEELELQKKAIVGYEDAVSRFKEKIGEILAEKGCADCAFPSYHSDLISAIYHENWGLSGIAPWFGEKYKESSSAKIIGDRIYFLENGTMLKQPQTISKERREQLVRALLLLSPDERMDKSFHELYLLDGTRVTIFRGSMTKEGQDVMIFRRYIVPRLSFEEQAERGTIPAEAISLFKDMVRLGYNVAFTGAVRTAKTTFLSTWQSYEDPKLEGVMVETDPEVPLHKIQPAAPIVQILADEDRLLTVTKNLLRSDADYMIMAEAREGTALDTVLKMASKGTRRLKITFHTKDPADFPYDVAGEVVKSMGGDLKYTASKAAASFDYIFHFVQLKDKSKKRLKSIYESGCDRKSGEIKLKRICEYDFKSDSWSWNYHISEDKRTAGEEEDMDAFLSFESGLRRLAGESERGA